MKGLLLCLLAFSLQAFGQTYTTNFDGPAENPLSEGGAWHNNSIDWQKAQKINGFACGTGVNYNYDDPYALMAGFPPDQVVTAVVHRDAGGDFSCTHEVEILLRFTDGPHFAQGYEVLNAGSQMMVWNGPMGSFREIGSGYVPGGLQHGDTVEASAIGNVLTVKVNGSQIVRLTDNTFPTGNPGIGFFRRDCGASTDFGWTSFTATGISGTPTVATPVISPGGGYFTDSVRVTLSCATCGAEIRYTTNGSAPAASSALYALPFKLTGTAVVKAMGIKSGMTNSLIATAAFTQGEPPAFLRKINFQPPGTAVPAGYEADSGLAYSAARGYGWPSGQGESRERNVNPDKRYDTFIKTYTATDWKLDVPAAGKYVITAVMGDPSYSTANTLMFGAQTLISAPASTNYTSVTDTLDVAGTQLVLSVLGAICYIDAEAYGGGNTGYARPGLPAVFSRDVRVRIYDTSGRMVRLLYGGKARAVLDAAAWDGRDQAGRRLSSGVYIARMETGNEVFPRKLLLVQ